MHAGLFLNTRLGTSKFSAVGEIGTFLAGTPFTLTPTAPDWCNLLNVWNLLDLLSSPDRARLTVEYTCPATTSVRRTVVVRRSPAVFTSAGVSRLRVSLRLDHDGTHMRVRPPGQSADAGALPRWTTGTARVHHPDAHGTPTWHASVGVGRG
jgi:hypothetical protein